jgi:phosphoribosylformimino-5-aminoimidazole carboxamide ribonucleotide (ProFAR) isomerase
MITGRALYDGGLDLGEAIKICRQGKNDRDVPPDR